MSKEIAEKKSNDLSLPAPPKQEIATVAAPANRISQLRLFTKGGAVNKGLVAPGNWGVDLGRDNIQQLGKKVDVVVLGWKPKTLDISDLDDVIESNDPESDEFKRIQAESSVKDSGCMFGPAFLVYERTSGKFLEYFCNNESARQVAVSLSGFLYKPDEPIKPCTLGNSLVEKKRYSWHAPNVTECSVPINFDVQAARSALEAFYKPPKKTEQASQEEVETRQGRQR